MTLSKNSFINGELITSDDEKTGKVLKFDSKNEFLNVESKDQFKINSLISGESSKSQFLLKKFLNMSHSIRLIPHLLYPVDGIVKLDF